MKMKNITLFITAIFMLALIPVTAFANAFQGEYERYFQRSFAPAQIGTINTATWERDRALLADKTPGEDVSSNYNAILGVSVLPEKSNVQPVEVCDASCIQLREGIHNNDIPTLLKLYNFM